MRTFIRIMRESNKEKSLGEISRIPLIWLNVVPSQGHIYNTSGGAKCVEGKRCGSESVYMDRQLATRSSFIDDALAISTGNSLQKRTMRALSACLRRRVGHCFG